jgi:hypothetical protein
MSVPSGLSRLLRGQVCPQHEMIADRPVRSADGPVHGRPVRFADGPVQGLGGFPGRETTQGRHEEQAPVGGGRGSCAGVGGQR